MMRYGRIERKLVIDYQVIAGSRWSRRGKLVKCIIKWAHVLFGQNIPFLRSFYTATFLKNEIFIVWISRNSNSVYVILLEIPV